MDEYISRKDAQDEACDRCNQQVHCNRPELCPVMISIKNIPVADVRPVVLCPDCKYCLIVDEYERWCNGFCSPARLVCADDYCSHGERRNV